MPYTHSFLFCFYFVISYNLKVFLLNSSIHNGFRRKIHCLEFRMFTCVNASSLRWHIIDLSRSNSFSQISFTPFMIEITHNFLSLTFHRANIICYTTVYTYPFLFQFSNKKKEEKQ